VDKEIERKLLRGRNKKLIHQFTNCIERNGDLCRKIAYICTNVIR
jgi:hypothetical protein